VTWTWRFDSGAAPADPAPDFTNQSDAETWLGENWRDLRSAGVTAVSLIADDAVVYGPMPLDA